METQISCPICKANDFVEKGVEYCPVCQKKGKKLVCLDCTTTFFTCGHTVSGGEEKTCPYEKFKGR